MAPEIGQTQCDHANPNAQVQEKEVGRETHSDEEEEEEERLQDEPQQHLQDHDVAKGRLATAASLPLPQRLGKPALRYSELADEPDEKAADDDANGEMAVSLPRAIRSDAKHSDRLGLISPDGSRTVALGHQDDTPFTRARVGRAILVLTLNSAIGGFLFGYDTGVVSGAMLQIKTAQQGLGNLTSLEQEVIVSSTIAGAVFGSLLSGETQKRLWIGRRTCILVGSGLFALGALLMGVAWDVPSITAGRVVVGIAVGMVSHVVPLYISECSPDELRGRLTAVNSIFIVLGQVSASLVCCSLARAKVPHGWRWMLGLGGVPAFAMFAGFLVMPESPRYILLKGRGDDESQRRARVVLTRLRGKMGGDLVKQEMRVALESLGASGSLSFCDTLRPIGVRRALLLGCFLQLLQQLTGVNTLMYYSATLLQMSLETTDGCGAGDSDGVAEICLSSLVAAAQLLGTVVGMCLVDRFGRRPLLLGSLVGVGLSLFLLAWSFHPGAGSASAPLLGMVLYLLAFGVGMAPLPWIVNAEIYPMEAKSTCVGIATATNWAANFLVAATFLDLATALSTDAACPAAHPDGTFFLYGLVATLGFMGLVLKMPETKGLSVEEISRVFERGPSGT